MLNEKSLSSLFNQVKINRGMVWGSLIIGALVAFELFNYSTTDFAMRDLLGDLRFIGIRWSTILAIAFCGIDFAGIARLFTPETGNQEPKEVWYLFGAWLLAATMNAALTWWGVSIALLNHATLGNAVVEQTTLLKVVPVFMAVLVWLIRILIIGAFSVAGDRLFSQAEGYVQNESTSVRSQRPASRTTRGSYNTPRPSTSVSYSPSRNKSYENNITRPEPTYHPVNMSDRSNTSQNSRKF